MEETLNQKKRRLFGKQYLSEYLNILMKITKYKNENEIKLLSIMETDKVINKNISLEKKRILKIPFKDKIELRRIVNEIYQEEEPVYLYTDLSNDCGLLFLNSINDFNFNFNFEDEPTGLIILFFHKGNSKILLDFYEENELQYIEIEHYQ